MKSPHILTMFLAASALALTSVNAQTTVTSDVVGYTTSTLSAGSGNVYAPAFAKSPSISAVLTSISSGSSSTLSTATSLSSGAYDETSDVTGVSKGYPQYYVEITNDTNSSDSLDTEGVILDIVSNSSTAVVVGVDVSALGLQGDEAFVIREHITLSELFANSTLTGYADAVSIYNEDGPGTAVAHVADGAGNWLLISDYTTSSNDAPIYTGTGFVLNNSADVVVTAVGAVKETATQVPVYGNSYVNILGSMKPLTSATVASELLDGLTAYGDVCTPYSLDGTLTGGDAFVSTGTGFVSTSDYTTPVTPTVNGTREAFVVNAGTATVVKISGNTL